MYSVYMKLDPGFKLDLKFFEFEKNCQNEIHMFKFFFKCLKPETKGLRFKKKNWTTLVEIQFHNK
jgi:hypothetical protein